MNMKLRSMLMMALCLVLAAVMVVGCGSRTPAVEPATFKQAE